MTAEPRPVHRAPSDPEQALWMLALTVGRHGTDERMWYQTCDGEPVDLDGLIMLGDESGARAVHCPFLCSPAAVEEVLHELAHASVGLAEEWRCYELEAVWALRLPASVSTAVAGMTRQNNA